MSRSPDPAVRAAWRRRVRAFATYRGTVRQFCLEQGVSLAAFYKWRRTLAGQQPSEKPLEKAATSDQTPPQFVPLRLVGHDGGVAARRAAASILLAGGTRVEIADGDLEFVQAILQSVMQHDARLIGQGRDPLAAGMGGAR